MAKRFTIIQLKELVDIHENSIIEIFIESKTWNKK